MSQLPERLSASPPHSRQIARAARAQEKTELAIYEHHLQARYLSEVDRIDSAAIADVTRSALEEEMKVLDEGLERAAGSQAKAELVSRMVAQQSRIDIGRIARRFGG
jgi:hypothetical protein